MVDVDSAAHYKSVAIHSFVIIAESGLILIWEEQTEIPFLKKMKN